MFFITLILFTVGYASQPIIVSNNNPLTLVDFNSIKRTYSDNNYNRYTYCGKKRIDASLLDETIRCKLEERLFKGKNHLKRSQGIVEVPMDVRENYFNYIKSEIMKL